MTVTEIARILLLCSMGMPSRIFAAGAEGEAQ